MAEEDQKGPVVVPADRLEAERARRKREEERALFEAAAGARPNPGDEILPLSG